MPWYEKRPVTPRKIVPASTDLLHPVKFQDIANLEIVKFLDADAAFVTGSYFFDIVLETFKTADRGIREDLTVAPDTYVCVSGNFTIGNITAGYLGFTGGKDSADFRVTIDYFGEYWLKQALHRFGDIIG